MNEMNEIISTNRKLFNNDNYAELRRNERIDPNIDRKKREYIICPECKEKCFITFKDYKINFNCKQNHITNNILLEDYLETQKNRKILKCNGCFSNNNDIQLYKCYKCDNIYCQNCKMEHDSNHNLIEVELINYYCTFHNKEFSFYCENCEENICEACKSEHSKSHSFINLNKYRRIRRKNK